MNLRVLYQDDFLIAVDKPAGFSVHPPEDPRHKVSKNTNCLHLLRRQTGKYLYPVHRLDRATSGVLIFALSSEVAARMQEKLQAGEIRKTYFAVVRGWTSDTSVIETPINDDGVIKPATTRFQTFARTELPHAIGRYTSSRYSLIRAEPLTGRTHQIRKHFAKISHPLIGDTLYGDGKHNRFFRELEMPGLFLKAYGLSFTHPATGETMNLRSRWNGAWHRSFEQFGFCPTDLFRL